MTRQTALNLETPGTRPASRRRRETTGRYIVGDKNCPTIGAALAYAATLAQRLPHPGSVYVHVPGEMTAAGRATLDDAGVVHLISRKGA